MLGFVVCKKSNQILLGYGITTVLSSYLFYMWWLNHSHLTTTQKLRCLIVIYLV